MTDTDPISDAETREVARQCGEIIAPLFPLAWAALTEARKEAG